MHWAAVTKGPEGFRAEFERQKGFLSAEDAAAAQQLLMLMTGDGAFIARL
jgi:hypothetical protein